ncbi:MAG: hypothetical protein ACC628_16150 [Pirellulaceae bacterium]
MTPLKSLNTVPFVSHVMRLVRHARTHGVARAGYSLSQAVLQLPGLRNGLCFGAVEIFHRYVDPWQSNTPIPRAFSVRVANGSDVPELADYFGDPNRIQRRFQRGDVCLMTLCREKVCAAVWFALGPDDYQEDWDALRCMFQFPADTTWCFDGKGTKWGAWGSLMAKVPDYLREQGVREVFTMIGCNNWQSIDSHKSLGYRSLGVITCFGALQQKKVLFREYGRRWQRLPGSMGNLKLVADPAE